MRSRASQLESAGTFKSDSWAAYVDLEAEFTEQFSAALAVRYEDYEEFDTTTDFKVSARYQITDILAVARHVTTQASAAPTPGQVNTLNITTTSDTSGNLIPNGTYPVDHPVALALGAVPLEAEDSQSFTLGIVALPFDNTSATLDFYRIDIEDRLALLNNTVGAAEACIADCSGNSKRRSAYLVASANYFVNGL